VAATQSIRNRLVEAAFTLFEEQGFKGTSVDDIAARAKVGRTTLFRHFGSKEALVFPDHDALLTRARRDLAAAPPSRAKSIVIEVATGVFDHYLSEGDLARVRYGLTRSVPALKDYETIAVSQYARLFTLHLKSADATGWDAALNAELFANAVVSAHNFVLRRWLREESAAPRKELADALARASALPSSGRDETTVVVLSTQESVESVVPRLRRALETPPTRGD
jgi:AcrR family transcriptional regulator